MRRLCCLLCLLLALVQQAFAQIKYPSAKATNSVVTILSDGLSEPNSGVTQILSEISVTLDKESDLRVLAVNGYGGPVNARDLLQLKGADLAIVNNDILAFLDLAKTLPEARRRIRVVTPLFHQTALLFGRQNIKSIDDLRGRKIGVSASQPSRGVTARTIFGLLKISAEFVELDDKDLAKRAGQDLDALLIFEKDLPEFRALGAVANTYHLLTIPIAGPLAKVYLGKKLGKAATGANAPSQALETVQVSTLLVAFDWSSKQGRYSDVVNFVEKFFELLPNMRARYPNSPLTQTDVRIDLPGWQRYGPAESLAKEAGPPSAKAESQGPLQPPSLSEALKLAVVSRPPLTNAQKEDGGVVLKLLTDALAATGTPTAVQWVDGERTLLDSLLTDKTADAGLFWQTPNCDDPRAPTAVEAALCDRALLSDPLMQVTIGVFTRLDASLTPKSAEPETRTLCIPESQTPPAEALSSIPWLRASNLKMVRPRTLIDCIAAVDGREADAVVAIEPEGRFTIERLKLMQSLQLAQMSAITSGLHVVVAKENPGQAKLLAKINEAISKFRASERYAQIMSAHLADLTGTAGKMP